jgi:transposase
VDLLEDYGFAPHLVHPLQCKAIASARLKNGKVDAAILAQRLRADLLPGAWIALPPVRQLRALLRHRAQLVRLRTLLRDPIHAPGRLRSRPARRLLERTWPGLACGACAAQTAKRRPDFAAGYQNIA